METPQSLSVIGSEQIRDQKPGKFDEILRYTPGVVAGTFGADTRNDWFLIRGFKSDDVGLFLDGLQLFYTSICELEAAAVQPRPCRGAARSLGRAVWRLQPERHRQCGQQDTADRADPLSGDRRQQFRQCLSVVRFRRSGRDLTRERKTVLSRGRASAERRHPGRFHARQQLFHRTVANLEARRRYPLHRAGVSLEVRDSQPQLPALCRYRHQRTLRPDPDQPVRQRSQRRYVQARAGDDWLSVRAQSLRRS